MTRCIHNRQECQGLEASSLAWLSNLVWIVTKSLVSDTLLIDWDYEMINMIHWKDNNNTVCLLKDITQIMNDGTQRVPLTNKI